MSATLIVIALLSLGASISVFYKVNGLRGKTILFFFLSWATGDLALFWIAAQAVTVAALVVGGALEYWYGSVGLGIIFSSWVLLFIAFRNSTLATNTFDKALRFALGINFLDKLPPERLGNLRTRITLRDWIHPFRMNKDGVILHHDIPYSTDDDRNTLDIYQPANLNENAPVLLQIHGGGWIAGHKKQQGLPLMYHLANKGWICISINYRLAPKHLFTDMLIDVKKAISWIKEHGGQYGMDSSFIAVTGGSAGGHLACLAALMPDEPMFQPGFEQSDVRVQCAVSVYGAHDFTDRYDIRGEEFRQFIEKHIMGVACQEAPELWEKASPIAQIHTDVPPFMVIHGDQDSIIPVEEARLFAQRLADRSENPVCYAEIPGAEHGFDFWHSPRTEATIDAIHRFLEWNYAEQREKQPAPQAT